ncbi:MAG: flagellar motor protein [Betaproteobacteria bacterium]|jgi:chemotaxis protein MotA|uniref:flagellar motor protein n=1 Tax=Thiomonas sp. FB-6 TaxID=1158291 RepID=UPI00036D0F0B|nr:flagellar motor protein [Thiomonas sp. FB-6]MBU6513554.1 flagellar motor protein [Betaproteobacteria bacterium]
MDFLSIVGLVVAIGSIVLGQLLEGGHLASILQPTAFLIVIGGTLGAAMLQYPLPVFLRSIRMLPWVVRPPLLDPDGAIRDIVQYSEMARRNGLLALESAIDDIDDPFLRRGLQLLVDGADPAKIRATMEHEIQAVEHHDSQAARVLESAGGYAPTVGILGAVLGLIHVMENLADPSKLGAGIAVAFVATIYGVGSANLFFLPVANKMKNIVHERAKLQELIVDGLVAIAEGENPRMIEGRLQGYFAH